MSIKCNLFDTIAIVIILNIVYNKFEAIRASIVVTRDKTIEEIHNII